jgi:hypothetical protein
MQVMEVIGSLWMSCVGIQVIVIGWIRGVAPWHQVRHATIQLIGWKSSW